MLGDCVRCVLQTTLESGLYSVFCKLTELNVLLTVNHSTECDTKK
jgi:hypothetical protein